MSRDYLKGRRCMVWSFMQNARMYEALRDYGDRLDTVGIFTFEVDATGTLSETGTSISSMMTYINKWPHIHWMLTGKKVLGVGDASGMFPIDSTQNDYDQSMVDKFDALLQEQGVALKLREIFPEVLVAGEQAGILTETGAAWLDPSGDLEAGIPLCPPEGDAGTGMTATNSVAVRTGNVSAGTSVFAMVVLETGTF